jgi:hypothetical protein
MCSRLTRKVRNMKSWLVPPVVLPIMFAMWIVISALIRVYG